MFYKIIAGIITFIAKLIFRIKIHGKENIPKEEGVILCANHIHFLDVIVMASCTNRQVHLIAKKELFGNKILSWVFKKLGAFPVDRSSKMDIDAYRTAISVLKKNKVLGIFFEGTRRKKLEEDETKSGVAFFAIKGKAPIVPIKIQGDYKLFVSKLNVYIGKPLNYQEYYGKKIDKDDLKKIVNELTLEINNLEKN